MNHNISLNQDVFRIDAQDWSFQIEAFIREEFSPSHRNGIVVPISGGLDSSVVAALCTRAIGKDKVLGLMLPDRLGNPEADHNGQLIAHHLGLQTLEINISPVLRALGTSNPFLAALSGRECWKRTVNRYLQKQGQTAGAF